MARYLYVLLICSSLVFSSSGFGLENGSNDQNDLDEDDMAMDGRLIIGTTGAGLFNASQLAAIVGLLASALLPLLALSLLCCAGVAYLLYKDHYQSDDGYGQTTYRSLGLDAIDWEKYSILDWISVGEEAFRKFDPTDSSCHKRLICEVHQSANKFGKLASQFVNLFGYLKFVELLNLPGSMNQMANDYLGAADNGRSLKHECGEFYPECDFSIKKLYDRFHKNEI